MFIDRHTTHSTHFLLMPRAAHSRVLTSWPMDKHQNIQTYATNSYCSLLWCDATYTTSQHEQLPFLHGRYNSSCFINLGITATHRMRTVAGRLKLLCVQLYMKTEHVDSAQPHLLQQPQHWFGVTELQIYWVSNWIRCADDMQVLCCYNAHFICLKPDML